LEIDIMAWNPSPKVAAVRDAAEKFGFDKAVLVLINEATGKFEVVSYGKTKLMCSQADLLGKDIHEAVVEHYETL
jgi:hypothetical protein